MNSSSPLLLIRDSTTLSRSVAESLMEVFDTHHVT